MTTLLLRLAGPLQSWGASSRFTRRGTERFPTRSGVLGMVAAAQGRMRTGSLADLADLRFGVRIDQPGRVEVDFQTARTLSGDSMPLTRRDYLTDAVFVAGIDGERELVRGIAESLHEPHFPLYLGRRSCPPEGPMVVALVEDELEGALVGAAWAASPWWRRRTKASTVALEVVIDAAASKSGGERLVLRDDPVSFDPERREYGWREVTRSTCVVVNPDGVGDAAHDPFAAIGGH